MHLYQQKAKLRNYLKDKYFSTKMCLLNLGRGQSQLNKFLYTLIAYFLQETTFQKSHMYSTLKRRGDGCFQVVSTWNTPTSFQRGMPVVCL